MKCFWKDAKMHSFIDFDCFVFFFQLRDLKRTTSVWDRKRASRWKWTTWSAWQNWRWVRTVWNWPWRGTPPTLTRSVTCWWPPRLPRTDLSAPPLSGTSQLVVFSLPKLLLRATWLVLVIIFLLHIMGRKIWSMLHFFQILPKLRFIPI